MAWNRTPEKLESLRAVADVIVTIVSANEPILLDAHIRLGTHIACMGTDTTGKQEIDAAILTRATVFTDEVAQSTAIGEAQHAVAAASLRAEEIVEIGAVIEGTQPGRTSDDEITVFDGTGGGLQDLAVASSVVERAMSAGVAIEVAFRCGPRAFHGSCCPRPMARWWTSRVLAARARSCS